MDITDWMFLIAMAIAFIGCADWSHRDEWKEVSDEENPINSISDLFDLPW